MLQKVERNESSTVLNIFSTISLNGFRLPRSFTKSDDSLVFFSTLFSMVVY